jgi:hypothetical protein
MIDVTTLIDGGQRSGLKCINCFTMSSLTMRHTKCVGDSYSHN